MLGLLLLVGCETLFVALAVASLGTALSLLRPEPLDTALDVVTAWAISAVFLVTAALLLLGGWVCYADGWWRSL